MRRRSATTAADNIHPQVTREMTEFFSERFRRFFEDRMTADVFWNTRIRNYRNSELCVLAEITNIFSHLLRARRAVHSDQIDGKRFERCKSCANFSPHQ